MTNWQITVRYGEGFHRYHTLEVQADDVAGAMRQAAGQLPDEVVPVADLVEVRVAVDPDHCPYGG